MDLTANISARLCIGEQLGVLLHFLIRSMLFTTKQQPAWPFMWSAPCLLQCMRTLVMLQVRIDSSILCLRWQGQQEVSTRRDDEDQRHPGSRTAALPRVEERMPHTNRVAEQCQAPRMTWCSAQRLLGALSQCVAVRCALTCKHRESAAPFASTPDISHLMAGLPLAIVLQDVHNCATASHVYH